MDELVEGICMYCKKPCEDSQTKYMHYNCAVLRWNELKDKKLEVKNENN